MASNQRKIDASASKQTSLFDIAATTAAIFQSQEEPEPGSLGIGLTVKELLSQALRGTPYKRWEIAGRMGEYAGAEITESMLNAWTAESKEGHRFPLEFLPAFCRATGDYTLIEKVVRACGCYLIQSEEVAHLELGRITESKKQLAQRERQVNYYLQLMRRDTGSKS